MLHFKRWQIPTKFIMWKGRCVVWGALFLASLPGWSSELEHVLDKVDSLLKTYMQPNQSVLKEKLVPALGVKGCSQNPRGPSKEDRVKEAMSEMSGELRSVLETFEHAAEEKKVAAVRAVVGGLHSEAGREGASRKFCGTGPALAQARQLFFVPKGFHDDPVGEVVRTISAFERLPKPDDYYYEYEGVADNFDLRSTRVNENKGAHYSHLLTSNAETAMQTEKNYILKKCRWIVISWYCNTNLYKVYEASSKERRENDRSYILFSALYHVDPQTDHSFFSKDRRTVNYGLGGTGLYVIYPSESLIMVYYLGLQSSDRAPISPSRLNDGHKLEARQLLERMEHIYPIKGLPFLE